MMACQMTNSGFPGDNTKAILARVGRDVIAHGPTHTILLAGTNDALNHLALVPHAEFAANLSKLVAMIRESGSKLILMTPPTFHKPYLLLRHPESAYGKEGPEAALAKTVSSVRSIAGALEIPLVDVNRIFKAVGKVGEEPASLIRNMANSNSEDGVHPTAEGYRVIATALYQCIRERALPCAKTVCVGDSITYGLNVAGMGTLEGESYPALLHKLLNA